MDDSKFNSFMNDIIATGETSRNNVVVGYWNTALGERRDEIISLYTERNISRRSIVDSLIKAGIVGEERTLKSFTDWMSKAIKKDREQIESEVEKAVSVNSAKISMKE